MNEWLTRTSHGWVEPMPPPCRCGSVQHMVGWAWCRCNGAEHGGHRSWRCRECGLRTLLGCTDAELLAENV